MNQPCRRQTAAGRFSGNLMTKVTVYFRTIRSGFNNPLTSICSLKTHPPKKNNGWGGSPNKKLLKERVKKGIGGTLRRALLFGKWREIKSEVFMCLRLMSAAIGGLLPYQKFGFPFL